MIDNRTNANLYNWREQSTDERNERLAKGDIQRLFELMPSQRYAYVIRKLVIEDCEPLNLAEDMQVTTANLYNIKRRAMAQLINVALNDIKKYGK